MLVVEAIVGWTQTGGQSDMGAKCLTREKNLRILEDISQARLSRLRAQTGRKLYLSVIMFGSFGSRREMEKKKEPQTSSFF